MIEAPKNIESKTEESISLPSMVLAVILSLVATGSLFPIHEYLVSPNLDGVDKIVTMFGLGALLIPTAASAGSVAGLYIEKKALSPRR